MRSIGGHEGLISIAADVAVAVHRYSTSASSGHTNSKTRSVRCGRRIFSTSSRLSAHAQNGIGAKAVGSLSSSADQAFADWWRRSCANSSSSLSYASCPAGTRSRNWSSVRASAACASSTTTMPRSIGSLPSPTTPKADLPLSSFW